MFREQFDVLLVHDGGQRLHGGGQVGQAASFGLCDPVGRVVVAVEDDAFVIGGDLLEYLLGGRFDVVALFELVGDFAEDVGDDGVQDERRAGGGLGRTDMKLELVAGEGERAMVAVGAVLGSAVWKCPAAVRRPV